MVLFFCCHRCPMSWRVCAVLGVFFTCEPCGMASRVRPGAPVVRGWSGVWSSTVSHKKTQRLPTQNTTGSFNCSTSFFRAFLSTESTEESYRLTRRGFLAVVLLVAWSSCWADAWRRTRWTDVVGHDVIWLALPISWDGWKRVDGQCKYSKDGVSGLVRFLMLSEHIFYSFTHFYAWPRHQYEWRVIGCLPEWTHRPKLISTWKTVCKKHLPLTFAVKALLYIK